MVDTHATRFPVSQADLASSRSALGPVVASENVSKTNIKLDPMADQGGRRRTSTQQKPGIQVTLDSQEKNPQLDHYRRLNSDGRRKDDSHLLENSPTLGSVTIEHADADRQPRSVPRSKAILDGFIEQMGGAERSQTRGNLINLSI